MSCGRNFLDVGAYQKQKKCPEKKVRPGFAAVMKCVRV